MKLLILPTKFFSVVAENFNSPHDILLKVASYSLEQLLGGAPVAVIDASPF